MLPSLAEMRDTIIAVIRSLFPDRNVGSTRSYHGRRATVLAAATTVLNRHVEGVRTDVLPTTAPDGAAIEGWGEVTLTERKDATGARKAAALRVRGDAAATADIDEELIHPESQARFRLTSAVVIPGVAPLYFDAGVEAIDTGSATRLKAGEVLEFISTPAGIETQAVLVKDLDEDGTDEEPYGAYRQRVLDDFGKPPSGGNPSDFEKWALEVDGIARARAYPKRAGLGTMDVAVLHAGTGAARAPGAGTRAEVLAYLVTKAPLQIAGTHDDSLPLRILEVVPDDPTDVELTVRARPDPAFEFDWSGSMTVAAYTAGTRTVQVTGGALPATLTAGARVVFRGVASAQLGEPMVVEAITGADTFTLQDVPDVAPAATDVVYPGGPLTELIRDAILAHLNGERVFAARGGIPKGESQLAAEDQTTIGLEIITEGVDTANPDGEYGDWIGGVLVDVLHQIAMSCRGVRAATVVAPAADVEGADPEVPDDDTIGLVIPGAVLVRPA